jgi:heme-degrading monooxygenase HmoA
MQATPTTTIIRVLTATVGQRASGPFATLVRRMLPILRSQDGLVHVQTARRLVGPVEEVVVFQEWRDVEAMYAWTGPDIYRPRLLEGAAELVERLVITHYEALDAEAESAAASARDF